MAPPPRTTGSILITGASTGFGRATTRHLLMNGWRVFATVRKEADRESLVAEAATLAAASRLHVLRCDVTDDADVRALGEAVAARTDWLDALLNNAGTAWAAPLELLAVVDLRAQLAVNTVAPIAVMQAVLPLLKTARGTIINVSSVSGRIATPVFGPYCASKFALEALSDALRVELAPFGVRVVLVEPGSFATNIWETSGTRAESLVVAAASGPYAPLLATFIPFVRAWAARGLPPHAFAVLIARILAAKNPRPRYATPRSIAVQIAVTRLLPTRVLDAYMRRAFKW